MDTYSADAITVLCSELMTTANRAQWRCSEGFLPTAEDADRAEVKLLHKIGNRIEALKKTGQSPYALRHALQQAVGNKTGHDRRHSRREKHVETVKQDFMAFLQDLSDADPRALFLCRWDPTLDLAREELAGKSPLQTYCRLHTAVMPKAPLGWDPALCRLSKYGSCGSGIAVCMAVERED